MTMLQQSILEAVQNRHKFGHFLDNFSAEMGLVSSCIFSIHDFSNLRTGFFWSKNIREQLPTEIKEKLEAGDDENERNAYASLMRRPAHVPYTETDLFGVTNYADLPFSEFRSVGEAFGVFHRISCVLNQKGPWMDTLFAHGSQTFPAQDYCINPAVTQLMPFLAQALELSRTLDALRKKYAATLASLDKLGLSVFVLDERGYVVEHNTRAQELLDRRDGLHLTQDQRLKCDSKQDKSALDHQIEAAFDVGTRQVESGVRNIAKPSGGFPLLWSMSAMKDDDGEFVSAAEFAVLTVVDPENTPGLTAEGLSLLGNLTTAEADVTMLLVNGKTVKDIAALREVQENSVRVQIKSILNKLRCRSQADLIRIAACTRLPLL